MPGPDDPKPPYDMPGPFIKLTADEANQVRMLSRLGHAIAPVPLKDGTLFLPLSVLDDPAHAQHHAFLLTLPQVATINTALLADGSQHPNEFRACFYNSSWQPGIPQHVNVLPEI
jgi:hypothetical protein